MEHLPSSLERRYQSVLELKIVAFGKYEHECSCYRQAKSTKNPPNASCTLLQSEKRRKKPLSCRNVRKSITLKRILMRLWEASLLPQGQDVMKTEERFLLRSRRVERYQDRPTVPSRVCHTSDGSLSNASPLQRNQFNQIVNYRRRFPGEIPADASSQDHCLCAFFFFRVHHPGSHHRFTHQVHATMSSIQPPSPGPIYETLYLQTVRPETSDRSTLQERTLYYALRETTERAEHVRRVHSRTRARTCFYRKSVSSVSAHRRRCHMVSLCDDGGQHP